MPGLDNRHRNHDGEIGHKHENTLIRTLPSANPACYDCSPILVSGAGVSTDCEPRSVKHAFGFK